MPSGVSSEFNFTNFLENETLQKYFDVKYDTNKLMKRVVQSLR